MKMNLSNYPPGVTGHEPPITGEKMVIDLADVQPPAKGGYVYLATPYSKYPRGRHTAWVEAMRAAAVLIRHRVPVFCPIVQSHPVSCTCHIPPCAHDIWMTVDLPLLRAAEVLVVVRMDGWEDSTGIRHEIDEAERLGIPVVYCNPL